MRSKTWSVAALMLALAGCAEANPGIEIEGILAEPEGSCTFTPSANPALTLEHRLDTSGLTTIRYLAVFQVVNRMLNQGNSTWPVMADPNSFNIDEAEIEIREMNGEPLALGDLPTRFRVPAVGFVPSGASDTEFGRAAMSVEVIPPIYGDALAGRNAPIVVAVRLRGRTSGDSEQTTSEFAFPVQLCDGCLFGCDIDEATGEPVENLSCFPGQDRLSFTGAACVP